MASRTLSNCLAHTVSTSSSKAFVQLASRRAISSAPFLDFLLPARPTPLVPRSNALQGGLRSAQRLSKSSRHFSASAQLKQTRCIYNPKRDEEGEFMNVEITPRAAHRLNKIAEKDNNPNTALRITVESGGCHGFQYLMSLTSLPPIDAETQKPSSSKNVPESTLDVEEDTVFDYVDEHGGPEQVARVVMDEPSLELLKGSKIDYTMELIGSQFKVVGNPRASSSCGCGTSFDVKF